MSRIIPFDQCVARPDDGNNRFLLLHHLVQVSSYMKDWLQSDEKFGASMALIRLYELAGLCHDLVKCDSEWQLYITTDPEHTQGPPHAPGGAFLFSYAGHHLLHQLGAWDAHAVDWWRLARDIADHHGSLKSTNNENWIQKYVAWERMDLQGMHRFLCTQVPELSDLPWNMESLVSWVRRAKQQFRAIERKQMLRIRRMKSIEAMRILQRWRFMTTGFIAADRFDVSPVSSPAWDERMWEKSEEHLMHFCAREAHHPLAEERNKAQRTIMERLAERAEHRFFTLEKPTGYGKTITSFKIAAWLGRQRKKQKLIYVAPYLSVLEQTASIIRKAIGRDPVEHHSLAVWDEDEAGSQQFKETKDQITPRSQLAIESWAHDIVCTSFQQFSRAIFPKRSQDTLRRAFLRHSIILIDEPQIFSAEGWNLFLTGLQALAEELDLHIVFLSATMPPFDNGLTERPVALSYRPDRLLERYRIARQPSMDEKQLAQTLLSRPETLQAAILNTIQDAYLVYREMLEQVAEIPAKLVHGLMIPLHKKVRIEQIRHHLKYHCDTPLYVISTQVLEAGVDVSFQHLARALPILPSIVQAAGRINRHGEQSYGEMTLFDFLRHGNKQTRRAIYASADLRDITDELLEEKEVWMESEVQSLIEKYYKEMFRRNSYTACKQAISEAVMGNWPALAKYEPFGADYFRLPLFVPWTYEEEDRYFIPPVFERLRAEFGLDSPHDIYDCYRDRVYWNGKDFSVRKRFMTLFQFYVLNLPVRAALKYATAEDYLQARIPLLRMEGEDGYRQNEGLVSHFDEMETIF